MPELLKAAVGSLIRWALTGVAGWLVAKGAMGEEQSTEVLLAISTGAAMLLWSFYQKYKEKLKFFTALEAPANATPEKVGQIIADSEVKENLAKALQ